MPKSYTMRSRTLVATPQMGPNGKSTDLSADVDSAIRSSSHCQQSAAVLLSLDDLQALEGGDVPYPDVAPSCAVHARATDGNALHRLLVALQAVQALALRCVPHLRHHIRHRVIRLASG